MPGAPLVFRASYPGFDASLKQPASSFWWSVPVIHLRVGLLELRLALLELGHLRAELGFVLCSWNSATSLRSLAQYGCEDTINYAKRAKLESKHMTMGDAQQQVEENYANIYPQ